MLQAIQLYVIILREETCIIIGNSLQIYFQFSKYSYKFK